VSKAATNARAIARLVRAIEPLSEAEFGMIAIAIKKVADERELTAGFARILADDDAMNDWARLLFDQPLPPVVRASVYGNDWIPMDQEICPHRYVGDDRRRPVLMRGAKGVLIDRSNIKSYWGECVAYRYLRRIRFTGVDHRTCSAMERSITDRLWKRGIPLNRGLPDIRMSEPDERLIPRGEAVACAWVNGVERCDITRDEWDALQAARPDVIARQKLMDAQAEVWEAGRDLKQLRRKVNERFGHAAGHGRLARKDA